MISAYTISLEPSHWYLWNIPWHNEVENRPVDKYRTTDSYVRYLAEKRNRAVRHLLEKFPETTDILCCDSSYVRQIDQLKKLIQDYEQCGRWVLDGHWPLRYPILGAAIYGPWRQRAGDIFRKRVTFSDPWGVPDLAWTKPDRKGLVETSGVSGVHIFPVSAWKAGVRYGCFPDRNTGTETTFFARNSGLEILIDMDAMLYRERVYSRIKCVRISLGIGTKFRKLFS